MSDTPVNAPEQPPVPDAAAIKVWLEYQYGDLVNEIGEFRDALQKLVDKYPQGLPDDEVAGIAGDNLGVLADRLKVADERRLDENLAYRQGQKTINDWFTDFIVTPVDGLRKAVQQMQNAYGLRKRQEQQRAADEAKRKAAEEARQAAAEAARAARENRADAIGQMEQAGRAAEVAQKAAEQAANVRVRVAGAMGGTGSGTVTWAYEITDFKALPDELKTWDHAKIVILGKKRDEHGRPVARIPGLKWVEKFSMRNR